MKKKTLSKKEIRELNEKLGPYGFIFEKKSNVEYVETDEHTFITESGEAIFFYLDSILLPTLRSILSGKVTLRKIKVDMGAIKFVVNGADIMRPGIVEIDPEIMEGEIIVIIDEKNEKPLAIGKAILAYQEMNDSKTGKVVKNIHFVGDEIWNFK